MEHNNTPSGASPACQPSSTLSYLFSHPESSCPYDPAPFAAEGLPPSPCCTYGPACLHSPARACSTERAPHSPHPHPLCCLWLSFLPCHPNSEKYPARGVSAPSFLSERCFSSFPKVSKPLFSQKEKGQEQQWVYGAVLSMPYIACAHHDVSEPALGTTCQGLSDNQNR